MSDLVFLILISGLLNLVMLTIIITGAFFYARLKKQIHERQVSEVVKNS